MTGYHEVKVFPYFPDSGRALKLPEGWKPFDTYMAFDNYERLTLHVVCLKWFRAEKQPSASDQKVVDDFDIRS